MLIEFAGCSGAGKTTLSKRVLAALLARDHHGVYSPDEVARATRTAWLQNLTLRNILLNFALLPWFVCTLFKHLRLYGFAFRVICRDGAGILDRVNRIRSTMRLLSCDAMLRNRGTPTQLTLVDEGVIACAQNMFSFAHSGSSPNWDEVRRFAKLAPVPDLIIHVDIPFELAVERAMKRSDPPIRRGHAANRFENFVSSALAVSKTLTGSPEFEGRVLTVLNGDSSPESPCKLTDQIVEFILDCGALNVRR